MRINRIFTKAQDLRVVVALAAAVVLSLGWAGVASAQTPFDVQYGSPTDSVGELSGVETQRGAPAPESGSAAALGVSASGSEGAAAVESGSSAVQGVEAQEAQGSVAAQGVSSGSAAVVGLLPDTGGSLLFIAAVVVAALSGLGLLVLRRAR